MGDYIHRGIDAQHTRKVERVRENLGAGYVFRAVSDDWRAKDAATDEDGSK